MGTVIEDTIFKRKLLNDFCGATSWKIHQLVQILCLTVLFANFIEASVIIFNFLLENNYFPKYQHLVSIFMSHIRRV